MIKYFFLILISAIFFFVNAETISAQSCLPVTYSGTCKRWFCVFDPLRPPNDSYICWDSNNDGTWSQTCFQSGPNCVHGEADSVCLIDRDAHGNAIGCAIANCWLGYGLCYPQATPTLAPTPTLSPIPTLPPGCSCNSWNNVGCGSDGCTPNQMYKTRTCSPVGCSFQTTCVTDATCIQPTPTSECASNCRSIPDSTCNIGFCGVCDRRTSISECDGNGDGTYSVCGGSCVNDSSCPGCSGCTNGISPEGWHDAFSGVQSQSLCRAAGWTNDNDNENIDLNIRVLVDGAWVITTTASNFRSDLSGVCPGATCAYDVNLYSLMSLGVNHVVTVQGQDINSCGNPTGNWFNLNNTPLNLNCSCTPLTPPTGLVPSGNTACGINSVTLSWNPVSGATKYAIRVDVDPPSWNGSCTAPDICDDNVFGTSYNLNVVPGKIYNWWVHAINTCAWGAPASTSFTVPLCPGCTVDLPNGGISVNTGSNYTVDPSATVVAGTINNIVYTVGNSAIASICDFPTSPTCPAGAGTHTDTGGPGFYAQLTGNSIGSTTLTAFATMNQGPTCSDVTALNGSAGPWWQVIGGDVTAAGNNMVSTIPTTCVLPVCQNVFILDNPTGSPGVPSVSGLSFPNLGSGTPSSRNWRTNNSPVILSDNYSYAFFENKIPNSIIPTAVGSSTIDGGFFESGGVEYPVGSGYYWYKYSGASDLTITDPVAPAPVDGEINLSSRKVILFVGNGRSLTIATRIRLATPGRSGMYIISDGDINIGSNVGHAAVTTASSVEDIEALLFADGQILTGSNTLTPADDDLQLHIRGSVSGLGMDAAGTPGVNNGVVFQRRLAGNSDRPAEIFEFAPDMILGWPPYLTKRSINWKEVEP